MRCRVAVATKTRRLFEERNAMPASGRKKCNAIAIE